jgi:hypothetical protein
MALRRKPSKEATMPVSGFPRGQASDNTRSSDREKYRLAIFNSSDCQPYKGTVI